MAARFPDFLIIGAMKCGTSSLHDQLGLRSRLFLSDPKEPNFFSDDGFSETGVANYKMLFEGARDDCLCGESSTHYTKLPTYPNTVGNLLRYVPEARLIYVMRDPIDRIVSQYIHEWTQREVRGTIDQAVTQNDRYAAYSSYALQLRPFLEGWGHERLLLVCFEKMIASPDAELARVCRFLGDPSEEPVHWDDSRGEQNVSKDRMRRSPLRERLLEVPALRALKDILPQSARDAIKSLWQMRKRPTLSVRVRADLEARIDSDLQELGRWVGADLTCRTWKKVAPQLAWAWDAPPQRTRSPEAGGALPDAGRGSIDQRPGAR